jgi:hypothetical protein
MWRSTQEEASQAHCASVAGLPRRCMWRDNVILPCFYMI